MFLSLIQAFATIAIIIGCLGLYGLVSFMAAQKTKEVGGRKVMGASVQNILWLFGPPAAIRISNSRTVGLVVMSSWLENFTYRIEIGAGIFVLTISATCLVAMITVGYRSLKAAFANPVDSLRNE